MKHSKRPRRFYLGGKRYQAMLLLLPKLIGAVKTILPKRRRPNRTKWYVIGVIALIMAVYALITGDFSIFWRLLTLLIGA